MLIRENKINLPPRSMALHQLFAIAVEEMGMNQNILLSILIVTSVFIGIFKWATSKN